MIVECVIKTSVASEGAFGSVLRSFVGGNMKFNSGNG
jgi:hypothetical protein